MKKRLISTVILAVIAVSANAQTKIKDGTVSSTPAIPAANAILELESSNKGFIPPRVALTNDDDATTIASPTDGMIVYNTATAGNITPGLYYFSDGTWKKLSFKGSSVGANANTQVTAYVGNYLGQLANGIAVGDFSFRISRRSDATTYTTSSEQLDTQIKYTGGESSMQITGYASTLFASGQFDYSNSALAAPSTAPQSGTRSNNLLNANVWYGIGEPGFAIADAAIEKRQYIITPTDPNANYFYRLEFMVTDATATCLTCTVGSPSENDAKVIILIEYVVAG